jgi:hypothetical protein
MMSYQDKTFCKARECSKFPTCPRALTDEVQARADRWWGKPGAPISYFAEPQKLECYDPSIPQTNQAP